MDVEKHGIVWKTSIIKKNMGGKKTGKRKTRFFEIKRNKVQTHTASLQGMRQV
jgi:hypothetical protein